VKSEQSFKGNEDDGDDKKRAKVEKLHTSNKARAVQLVWHFWGLPAVKLLRLSRKFQISDFQKSEAAQNVGKFRADFVLNYFSYAKTTALISNSRP